MQISGSQSGANFFSAYQIGGATTRPSPAATADDTETPSPTDVTAPEVGANSDKLPEVHRGAMLYQSAHRVAARTADLIEAMPVL